MFITIMPTVQGPYWSFTLNFEETLPILEWSDATVQYAVWQHERAAHDHLQGFLQLKKKDTTLRQVSELFQGYKPHLKRVTINESGRKPWEYCMKPETRVTGPWEFGIFVPPRSNKRKKIAACENSPERMSIEDPDLFHRYEMMKKRETFRLQYEGPSLDRPWQRELRQALDEAPDDRTIIWVYGPNGGEGKTTFSKQLEKEGWFVTSSGRHQDLMYLYVDHGSTAHVCIDFSRSVDTDHFYPLIEDFKNRRIKSTKYKPVKFTELKNIHVVVMSNVYPDTDKISCNRLKIIECQ